MRTLRVARTELDSKLWGDFRGGGGRGAGSEAVTSG